MARNRAKPNRNANAAPRPSGRHISAPSEGKPISGSDINVKTSMWDGKKYVEVDPEEIFRLAGIVRIHESEKGSETVRWTKSVGNLKPSKRATIQSSIISTLKQVESVEERQSIFNSVAADLGLDVPQTSEPRNEVATDGPSGSLPAKAPEIYRERSNPIETAEQFLRRAYEPWLASSSLFQFHIGKLDPTLLQGLKNQFKGRSDELRALLPRKKDEVDQRIAALVGKEVTDPAQRRLLAQAERNMTAALDKLKI